MSNFNALGQFSERRKSPLSGLSEAIGEGFDSGVRANQVKAQAEDLKLRAKEHELRQLQEERKAMREVAANLTIRDMKEPNSADRFFEMTVNGKQMKNSMMKVVPQAFGPDGKFVGLPDKETADIALQTKISEVKLKKSRGIAVTPAEDQLLASENNPQMFNAMANAIANNMDLLDPTISAEEKQKIMQGIVGSMQQASLMMQNPNSSALATTQGSSQSGSSSGEDAFANKFRLTKDPNSFYYR